MLTLVMPDCLTASITVANAPKGTFSSARIKMDCSRGSRIFSCSTRGNLIDVDGIVAEKYSLVFIDGDD